MQNIIDGLNNPSVSIILVVSGAILGIYILGKINKTLKKKNIFESEEYSIFDSILKAPKPPFVIGIFLFLIGIIFLILPTPSPTLTQKLTGAAFTELGFAFLIAFVVHVTIDYQSRKENQKEISKGILAIIYLFGPKGCAI